MKWWTTVDRHHDYIDLPYLNVHNADVLEPPCDFCNGWSGIGHTVPLALVKIRLLHIQAMDNATMAIGPVVPQEILDQVRREITGSDAIPSSLVCQRNLAPAMATLRGQITQLFGAVDGDNKHFWPMLVNPGSNLTSMPSTYSLGSVQEAQMILKHNHPSWTETPGPIAFIRELRRHCEGVCD